MRSFLSLFRLLEIVLVVVDKLLQKEEEGKGKGREGGLLSEAADHQWHTKKKPGP